MHVAFHHRSEPWKKKCFFLFQTKLFYQKPQKKTTKFCLFVQDTTNYRTRWSRKKKVKHSTFKSEKASSWATMRRKESVEQNKNRRKNLMINPTDDIEASGESSFWWSRRKFYDLGWNCSSRINETEKEEKKEVISIAAAGKGNKHEEKSQFSNHVFCTPPPIRKLVFFMLITFSSSCYWNNFLLLIVNLSLRNNFIKV